MIFIVISNNDDNGDEDDREMWAFGGDFEDDFPKEKNKIQIPGGMRTC